MPPARELAAFGRARVFVWLREDWGALRDASRTWARGGRYHGNPAKLLIVTWFGDQRDSDCAHLSRLELPRVEGNSPDRRIAGSMSRSRTADSKGPSRCAIELA